MLAAVKARPISAAARCTQTTTAGLDGGCARRVTATAVGTKIYAIGGARNPSYSTPELRPMLTAHNHHGAARIDGRIYVVGGRIYAVSGANVAGGGRPHESVQVNEAYDPR